jgi:hypothetical protein
MGFLLSPVPNCEGPGAPAFEDALTKGSRLKPVLLTWRSFQEPEGCCSFRPALARRMVKELCPLKATPQQ